MNITQKEYFKRQTTLSEIGNVGQKLLQNAKVLVIGCGGLGSPIAIYLAASGIGELHLVDFDIVSISNLHRQIFFTTADIGKPKAAILANEIKKRTPFTKVTFTNKAVDKKSILDLISSFDVVVDGTDNLSIKYLINDACVIAKKPLVYGSLYKFDGYVSTFNVVNNEGEFSCNLRDAFPKIANEIPNCEEAGTMNPIVGCIAMLQVNEVIKLITKTGNLLTNQLLIYNALNNTQFKIKLKMNASINVEFIFKNSFYIEEQCETQFGKFLITSIAFKKYLTKSTVFIINVADKDILNSPFKVHQHIPFYEFDIDLFKPDFKKEYIIVCKKGIKSYEVVVQLKSKFPTLIAYSLVEGTDKFS